MLDYETMLLGLSFAVRRRVVCLAMGHGGTQEWVHMWTYCCTYAVLVMTLALCLIRSLQGIGMDEKADDITIRQFPLSGMPRSSGVLVH